MQTETLQIQKTLYETSQNITYSVGVTISSLLLALAKGWEFSLIILAVTPFVYIGFRLNEYMLSLP